MNAGFLVRYYFSGQGFLAKVAGRALARSAARARRESTMGWRAPDFCKESVNFAKSIKESVDCLIFKRIGGSNTDSLRIFDRLLNSKVAFHGALRGADFLICLNVYG